ncbi:MAG: hypothetical protein RLZZ165_1076 [Bacteroidota bacterium]
MGEVLASTGETAKRRMQSPQETRNFNCITLFLESFTLEATDKSGNKPESIPEFETFW